MDSSNPWVGQPAGEPFYLHDFQQFVDAGLAVAATGGVGPDSQGQAPPVTGKWRLEQGYWGAPNRRLLRADATSNAPVLTLDPQRRGWHAIYLHVFSPTGRQLGIYVRLTGQPHFTFLQAQRHEPSYERLYFLTADLTGKRIELAHFQADTALAQVELIPVNQPTLSAGNGAALGILDFADDAGHSRPTGFEAGSAIRRHADAGYSMVMWKAYAVRCEYHTKIGVLRGDSHKDEAAVVSDNLAASNRSIGQVLRQYDTMRQAVDEAKKVGLPIFGWARISNEFSRPDHQFSADTPFHRANPDKFQQYRDGRYTCKLSFAYPEVRRHKIDILCEIASYGMDGIFIDVLRHPPLVMFDQPVVRAYLEKTGRDPRQTPGDGEEDWLRFRAEHTFTRFLSEARAALDAARCRHVPLYVRTVDQLWYNLLIGCDVSAWIERGLVDGIVFGPWCAGATNYPDRLDLRPYLRQARGRVKIFGQVWRYGSVLHALDMARDLYDQGVQGVALYESNATVAMGNWRENLWRLSRPETLR